ncbi:JmjC domain-containing histone demethylation protein 1, partial [Nowakowskiella sp. JEL0078]
MMTLNELSRVVNTRNPGDRTTRSCPMDIKNLIHPPPYLVNSTQSVAFVEKASSCPLSLNNKRKRKSARDRLLVNYSELHNGPAPMYDEFRFRKLLAERTFVKHQFPVLAAHELTYEYAQETGFLVPVIVPVKDGLDLVVPDDGLTVRQIAQLCGYERVVDVLEVATQSERLMTLREWTEYWETPIEERRKILNVWTLFVLSQIASVSNLCLQVISLEFSQTKLANLVRRPRFVRDIDWIDTIWPAELKATGEYPQVQLYCLMSVQDSFTDFHIDFAGSSVFYHVLSGQKTFYFVQPTPRNLKEYEKWSSSPDQSKIFFGDLVNECSIVNLHAGMTMLIPSGWIHAVYTPSDAIIIGGNYLNGFACSTQLDVWRIEERTRVPQKFRFPYFEKMLWWAARYYLKLLKANPSRLSIWELSSLDSLTAHLNYQSKLLSDLSTPKEKRKKIRKNIPSSIKNVAKLVKSLNSRVNAARHVKEFEGTINILQERVESIRRFAEYNDESQSESELDVISNNTDGIGLNLFKNTGQHQNFKMKLNYPVPNENFKNDEQYQADYSNEPKISLNVTLPNEVFHSDPPEVFKEDDKDEWDSDLTEMEYFDSASCYSISDSENDETLFSEIPRKKQSIIQPQKTLLVKHIPVNMSNGYSVPILARKNSDDDVDVNDDELSNTKTKTKKTSILKAPAIKQAKKKES